MVASCRSLRAASLLLLAVALVSVNGCTAWKRQRSIEVLQGRSDPPDEIRITLADGTRREFKHPQIRGDSMVGLSSYAVSRPNRWDGTEWERSSIALADIRQVEIRKFDAARTLLFVGVGVGATVAIVAIVNALDSDPKPSPAPPPSSGGGLGDGCFLCSCPLLYSWSGREWVLDSGTFGGAFLRPLAYTDYDNLDALVADRGAIRLRLEAGDQETDHIDEVAILAVDHPPGTSIATDPDGKIHTIGSVLPPRTARDTMGRDALPLVAAPDERCWESALAVRDTSSASLRDGLELEFARPANTTEARLVLRAHKTAWAAYLMRSFVRAHGAAITAWYAAMESSPQASARFRGTLQGEVHLDVSIWKDGQWVRQASVWGGGPEIPKTHAVPLDLSGITGPTVRVRVESAPSFWLVDYAALDATPEAPFQSHELTLATARSNRGMDVRPALRSKDGVDLILETGDAVELALDLPPLPSGMNRSFLSRTHGWYRFHAPATGPADARLLDEVLHRPHGISRASVAMMNRALVSMH